MKIRTPYFIASLCMLAAAGCVERRITIMSEPSGATAYLDGDELGTTPITTSFIFYGSREVRVEMDGYETQVRVEEIRAPFYERFPIDLISEVFIPWTITDRRYLPYKLEASPPVDKDALVARAEAFRAEQTVLIAQQREERRTAEMRQRQAERRQREEQGLEPKKKWYHLFF